MSDNPLNLIVEAYYAEILRYCKRSLRDSYAAEDCTQEVFMLFIKKAGKLDLTRDIRPWLYAAADRIMKSYLRSNPPAEDIDELPEPSEEFPFRDSILDELEEDERDLLIAYYNADDHKALAKERGISPAALYMRIVRIRNKLRKEL